MSRAIIARPATSIPTSTCVRAPASVAAMSRALSLALGGGPGRNSATASRTMNAAPLPTPARERTYFTGCSTYHPACSVKDMASESPARRRDGRSADLRGTARERLLDAGLAELREHGYAATSLQAIARRAGLTKGAVYWSFRDKQDLF